jgi:hypothetical protein
MTLRRVPAAARSTGSPRTVLRPARLMHRLHHTAHSLSQPPAQARHARTGRAVCERAALLPERWMEVPNSSVSQSAHTSVRYLEIIRAPVCAEATAVAWREDINQVARPALWLDCLAARAPALPTFGLRTPKPHREAQHAACNRQHSALTYSISTSCNMQHAAYDG